MFSETELAYNKIQKKNMADKLASKVQEFMDGDENTMGWVLKETKGNSIVVGDDDDILFNIVVLDAGKFVSFVALCTNFILTPISNRK